MPPCEFGEFTVQFRPPTNEWKIMVPKPPSMRAGIPEPPPRPRTDPGAGKWSSQPWYSRFDDYAYAEVAGAVVMAADALGYTNAAAHLNHYLNNSGNPYTINVDKLMHDIPSVNAAANALAEKEIRKVVAATVASSSYGNTVAFQSKWGSGSISQSESADWYFAMAAYRVSVTGTVTTREPAEGAAPSVVAEYKVHFFDRYNWDTGKHVEIAGITISDKNMGELHTAGRAREFDLQGTSDVRRYEGTIPASGSVKLPGSSGSRDGERTDPNRG